MWIGPSRRLASPSRRRGLNFKLGRARLQSLESDQPGASHADAGCVSEPVDDVCVAMDGGQRLEKLDGASEEQQACRQHDAWTRASGDSSAGHHQSSERRHVLQVLVDRDPHRLGAQGAEQSAGQGRREWRDEKDDAPRAA